MIRQTINALTERLKWWDTTQVKWWPYDHGLPWSTMIVHGHTTMVKHGWPCFVINGKTVFDSQLTQRLTMVFYPWKTMVNRKLNHKDKWEQACYVKYSMCMMPAILKRFILRISCASLRKTSFQMVWQTEWQYDNLHLVTKRIKIHLKIMRKNLFSCL